MPALPTPNYGLLLQAPQGDPVGAAIDAYKTIKTAQAQGILAAAKQQAALGGGASGQSPLVRAHQNYFYNLQKYGPNDPRTKSAEADANIVQKQYEVLTGWHSQQTQSDWFGKLTPQQKNIVGAFLIKNNIALPGTTEAMQAGGALSQPASQTQSQGVPSMPQVPTGAPPVSTPTSPVQSSARDPNAPSAATAADLQTPPSQSIGGQESLPTTPQPMSTLSPQQIAAQQQQIYQQQFSPAAQAQFGPEAKENEAYLTTVNQNADKAQDLMGDLQQVQGALNKAMTGLTPTMTNFTTAQGQELKAALNKLYLQKFQNLSHVGQAGRAILGVIKGMKPSDWQKPEAAQHLIDMMNAATHRVLEKQEMVGFLHNQGITDRTDIDRLWNGYMKDAPAINVEDNGIDYRNLDSWASYVASHAKSLKDMRTMTGQPVDANKITNELAPYIQQKDQQKMNYIVPGTGTKLGVFMAAVKKHKGKVKMSQLIDLTRQTYRKQRGL